jgi:hypothetical protein
MRLRLQLEERVLGSVGLAPLERHQKMEGDRWRARITRSIINYVTSEGISQFPLQTQPLSNHQMETLKNQRYSLLQNLWKSFYELAFQIENAVTL